MSGVNKVILVGNLGKDPEVRYLEGGTAVANFPLATSEVYKDKSGERKEITEWHNIVMWRGLAEIAEKYLKKGNSIYVEGKLRTRSWDDKEGVKRYTTEVLADNMTMLGGKSSGSGDNSSNAGESKPAPQVDESSATDDLPF